MVVCDVLLCVRKSVLNAAYIIAGEILSAKKKEK